MIDPKEIRFLPDYPVRSMSEIGWCGHEKAQFQGMFSLVGYYHCPDCESRICPQEFQRCLNFSSKKLRTVSE